VAFIPGISTTCVYFNIFTDKANIDGTVQHTTHSIQHTVAQLPNIPKKHEGKQVNCNMYISVLCTSHEGGHATGRYSAKADRKKDWACN